MLRSELVDRDRACWIEMAMDFFNQSGSLVGPKMIKYSKIDMVAIKIKRLKIVVVFNSSIILMIVCSKNFYF